MNFKQLEAFLAFMTTGSTIEAAQRLGSSQPAVSRLLSQFESDLGVPLFVRRKGRLHPTAEALSLIHIYEPTTALDVTIQAQILAEMQKLCAETGTAMVWVSHDLAVVAGLADRVCVMYAGRVVESGGTDDILDRPRQDVYKRQCRG